MQLKRRERPHWRATLITAAGTLCAAMASSSPAAAQGQPKASPTTIPVQPPTAPTTPAPPTAPSAPTTPAPSAPPTTAPTAETPAETAPKAEQAPPQKDAKPKATKDAEATKEKAAEEPTQPVLPAGEERPVPNYDGREKKGLGADDVLVWIPRSILAPIYLVTEYLIRWPLGKLVSALDVNDVPNLIADFFTFGPGDKSGLVPSGLIDFGFRPSIGLYFFSDDVLVNNLGVRANIAYGGDDWYLGKLRLSYQIQEATATQLDHRIDLGGTFSHRPDFRFHGVGADSLQDDVGRFTGQQIDGTIRYEGGIWRSSRLEAEVGVRDVVYKNTGCCDDPQLIDRVAQGTYELPTLYNDGYLVARGSLMGSFDTRERRNAYEGEGSDHLSPSGSGFKLAARADAGIGLRNSPPLVSGGPDRVGYIRYGGTVGGFWDVYAQRVFGLQLIADFIDPFEENAPIPFTELVSLGGFRPMPGFLQQRLLGRSSIVGQLEYTWPVAVWADGVAHYSVGNVFDKHLNDFQAKKLRQSFGFGIRANDARDHAFEVLIAGGTATFEQGSSVDSLRFVFGSSTGF